MAVQFGVCVITNHHEMTVGNNGLSTRRSSSSASVGDGREENGQATAKENVISKAGKFRRALPQVCLTVCAGTLIKFVIFVTFAIRDNLLIAVSCMHGQESVAL